MSRPRPTSCLIYFRDCAGVYTLPGGKAFTAPCGSVVYIPAGAVYTVTFTERGDGEIATTLIEFNLTEPDGQMFTVGDEIISVGGSGPIPASLFDEAVSAYAASVVSYSVLKSVLYRILSEFSSAGHKTGKGRRAYQKIRAGIPFIESYADEKSISEIAALCHVSESCFRRLFRQYAGVGPTEYRIRVKTEYAKRLLRETDMTVAEIAEILKYNDPAYFCRVFKRVTGFTPGEYAAYTGIRG